jgi:hypothetical protein
MHRRRQRRRSWPHRRGDDGVDGGDRPDRAVTDRTTDDVDATADSWAFFERHTLAD